jgi:hypothetical protein
LREVIDWIAVAMVIVICRCLVVIGVQHIPVSEIGTIELVSCDFQRKSQD